MIVTTYNRPEALRAVLAGFAAQSDRDFELLVADDGSGPETGALRMELTTRLIDVRSNITVPAPLAMELTAALVQPVVLRMEVSAALANVYASA